MIAKETTNLDDDLRVYDIEIILVMKDEIFHVFVCSDRDIVSEPTAGRAIQDPSKKERRILVGYSQHISNR